MLGEAVGEITGSQKNRVLAELVPQVIHRLVDPGEPLNFERVLKEFQLPHGILFETEEHNACGAVLLALMEKLRKSGLNRVENVMGEGRSPRELDFKSTHEELLGLQRDKSAPRGELILAGLDASVFNILGELRQHKISLARWRRERFPF